MGLFSRFKQNTKSNETKAHSSILESENQETVKLIQPNSGRIVTLQVFGEDPICDLMIAMLCDMNIYQHVSVASSGNVVTFTFSDDHSAEEFRSAFKK